MKLITLIAILISFNTYSLTDLEINQCVDKLYEENTDRSSRLDDKYFYIVESFPEILAKKFYQKAQGLEFMAAAETCEEGLYQFELLMDQVITKYKELESILD